MYLRLLFFILLLSAFSKAAEASVIRGIVTDFETKEPLSGAVVVISEKNINVETNDEGAYEIKNLSKGSYTMYVHHIGYMTIEKIIEIKKDDEDLNLPITLLLENNVSEVTVVGRRDKESEQSALKQEQNADNVINVISGRSIELSPDISVANVSQRISGISLERSNQGDGRYAIIRGMDQRYNNTLINGVKIPSPDAKSRFIPLDIFPAEMLMKMEVHKALTPDLEGDAIGGTINLVLKDAPDTTLFQANLAGGYNQLVLRDGFSRWNHRTIQQDPSSIHGNQYFPNVSDFQFNSLQYQQTSPLGDYYAGLTAGRRFFKSKLGVLFSGIHQDYNRRTMSTFYSVVQDPNNSEAIYEDRQIRTYSTRQRRSGLNLKLDYNINQKNKLIFSNIFMNMDEIQARHIADTSFTGSSTFKIKERSRFQRQQIYSQNLQGVHNIGARGIFDWSLVHARAFQDEPDNSELTMQYAPPATIDSIRFENIRKEWQKNNDRDLALYVNYSHNFRISDIQTTLKTGGLYRDKNRHNKNNVYNFRHLPPSAVTYDISMVDPNLIYVFNYNPDNTIYSHQNYETEEQITALYVSGTLRGEKWMLLGGLRYEDTRQEFNTQVKPGSLRDSINGATVTYADALPSVHLRYSPKKNQNIRASYFKSISRPNYFELVPYTILGEIFNEAGNPHLKHTIAHNFDLRYEIFPGFRDQLMIGGFYKIIENPIEWGFIDLLGKTLAPQNYGTAYNVGFEVQAIKYFGYFGISGNYTFTDSRIEDEKVVNDAETQTTRLERQTRSLQGQSRHIANLSLLYRNDKHGLNAQLAYVMTGRRISRLSVLKDFDFYQNDFHLLDLSIEKKFLTRWVIYTKITNLLNTPYRLELQNGLPVQEDFYSQYYMLGIRFKI